MSRKLNLMLHCGSSVATREEIEDSPTPEGTRTWKPIPHRVLVDMLHDRLPQYGMEATQEAHGLHKEGNRYFGLFQVSPIQQPKPAIELLPAIGTNGVIGNDGATLSNSEDMGMVFGLRNSHDKKFPAGLCLGNGVFVCDNLSFSAEIVIGRRHTRYIMRDLPHMINLAVGRLMDARNKQTERFAAYKEHELTNTGAHHLIVEAMRAGAINPTRVPKVVDQWHTPAHPEFKERNAFSLFNAFTEVYKSTSLVELPKRTTRLHGLLDAACGLSVAV